jgi:hypothetical protein
MDVQLPKLQTKTLRRATDPSAYKLYRAAQEWDLVDPILIRDRQDLKSEPKWHDHIEPYYHQISNLVTFCRRLPVTLLADDVGLGKTISAGLIASELMARHRVSKILVVCPKLLMPQWKEELETKFAITGVEAVGNELVKAKVPDDGGAIITTYHSARMYPERLGEVGFEMLILDEAHKLRNLYGTNQPPQVAQRFRDALANRMFKYVLMLTATPLQNRLWDIYSLVDLLSIARGHQNPFGSEGGVLELLSLTIGQKLVTWPLICGTVSDRLCTAICPGFGGRMQTYTSLSVSSNYTRLIRCPKSLN